MTIVLAIVGVPLIVWAILIQICNWRVLIIRIRKTDPNASFVLIAGPLFGTMGFLLVASHWRPVLDAILILVLDPGVWALPLDIVRELKRRRESPEPPRRSDGM